MPIVLACDIATHTGVCHDGPDGRPIFSTIKLPPSYGPADLGPRLKMFTNRLYEIAGLVKPDIIAVEAPLTIRGDNVKSNIDTVRLLISLASQAHYVACCLDPVARVIEKNVMTVKKHLTGSGRADKRMVMAAAHRLGWNFKNDHEADAGALWSLVKCEIDKSFSHTTTPMFGGPHARAAG